MTPARDYKLPVLALGFISNKSTQQDSTNVSASSVVTCVSTSDQRQHIPDLAGGREPVVRGFSSD
jgi:hypothetical protein